MKSTTASQIRAALIVGVLASTLTNSPLALAATETNGGAEPSVAQTNKVETKKPEPKSESTKAADSTVQTELAKDASAKRAQLLADAQSALEDTKKALGALDQGKKDEALSALEKVSGKLDLIVARDPALALAPVGVSTIIRDLYAGPDTAKDSVKMAKDLLSDGKVQEARAILSGLASEAEVQVTNIPLATYPAAIRAVAPLIDAGKLSEAKTALSAAMNTLVIESYVTPLPKIRAQAILADAEKLAAKSGRSEDENKQLHAKVEAARDELKLGEVLGYGSRDDYKPLYGQLDEIQKKSQNGKVEKGLFDSIKESLKRFKDRIL